MRFSSRALQRVDLTEGAPARGSTGVTKINLFVSAMNRRFAEIAFSSRDTRNVSDFHFVYFPPPPRAYARNGYIYVRGLLVLRLTACARGRLARIANQIECAPLQRRLHCADDVRTRYSLYLEIRSLPLSPFSFIAERDSLFHRSLRGHKISIVDVRQL